ncbi:MAG: hypothetical protein EPN37_04520 [Chitinophagaceae bacterium]|nr:MAG: hypothetical protein EPN37_04520 [Chitinophagaceae bacterium]
MLLYLILFSIIIGVCIAFLPSMIGAVLGFVAAIGLFFWRLLQSFWKLRIWTVAVWCIVAIPVALVIIYADHDVIVFGILGAWTFFVSGIATVWCYRDGRTLKQAP